MGRGVVLNLAVLLRRVHERLIDRGVPTILQAVVVGMGHALNHGHEHDVIGRIDPEPGPGGTIPEERALSVRQTGFRRIKDDRAVEP